MAIAKITLIGMYQWMNDQNDPLFKNLTVPVGMDKDKLINTILYHGAEFGVLYADPHFMQALIGVWSDRYYHTLNRWVRALEIEYDPLENYDRREEWYDSGLRSKTGSSSRSGSEVNGFTRSDNSVESTSKTGSDSGSTSRSDVQIGNDKNENTGSSSDVKTSSSKDTTTNSNATSQTTAGTKTGDQSEDHKVSAFDSSSYQNKDKTDTNNTGSDVTVSQTNSSGTTNVDGNVNSVEQHQSSEGQSAENNRIENESTTDSRSTNETGTGSRITNGSGTDNKMTSESGSDAEAEGHSAIHTGRLHGNIGVTTSQQMLQSELDIARFNIYDEAADLFISEFCIYVY